MKRLSFLTCIIGLAGVASAQQKKASLPPIENGTCPVCLTPKADTRGPIIAAAPDKDGIWADRPIQTTWMARCRHCNAAFWQDPEK